MLAIGREHRQAIEPQLEAMYGVNLAVAAVGSAGKQVSFNVQGLRERMQPVNAGGKAAKALKVLNDHGQCAQDGCEGAGRLDRPADLQAPRKHIVRNDHGGQYDRQEAMGVLEQVELELPAQHLPVVGIHGCKYTLQRRHFARLAVVESDGFRMFAHPHQAETKVRLALQLAKVQAN